MSAINNHLANGSDFISQSRNQLPFASLFMNVGILTLVVLGVRLVLSLIVLILGLLDSVQLLHDVLSLWLILSLNLLDELLGVRSGIERSLIRCLDVLHGFRRAEAGRSLRNSQRRNVTLSRRGSCVFRSFGVRRA